MKTIATKHKTSYIWGGIGQPITDASIDKAVKQYGNNATYEARARKLIGKGAFAFDCVGVIKSILWGWTRRLKQEPWRSQVRLERSA